MLGFLIFVYFNVNLIKVSAVGPMCFDCSHISHARYCTNYVQCADDEVCHVQKFITHSLHEQYSSGCVKNQTCHALQGKRFLDSGFNGLATCFECCHGDMCNNKGCGDEGPPPRVSRGPYCFQCDHLSDPRECEHVTICLENEVCGIDEAAVGVTETEYFSGCKRKSECLSPAGLFGRDLEQKRNGFQFCHTCCDGDFCNMDCIRKNTSQEQGLWGTWGSWSDCSNNGTKERSRDCIGPLTHSLLTNCHGDAHAETDCPLTALKVKLDCDFNFNFCSWQQSTDDDFDWTRHNFRTASPGTGPDTDHTLATAEGYYIYTESSLPRRAGDTARILSPAIHSTDDMCLRFWYNMYGHSVGSLKVYLQTGATQRTPVWEQDGDQGKQWNFGSVGIQGNSTYRIVFESAVGLGYNGDVALDDVTVVQEACSSVVMKI